MKTALILIAVFILAFAGGWLGRQDWSEPPATVTQVKTFDI